MRKIQCQLLSNFENKKSVQLLYCNIEFRKDRDEQVLVVTAITKMDSFVVTAEWSIITFLPNLAYFHFNPYFYFNSPQDSHQPYHWLLLKIGCNVAPQNDRCGLLRSRRNLLNVLLIQPILNPSPQRGIWKLTSLATASKRHARFDTRNNKATCFR